MDFTPTLRYFLKNNARNIEHMTPLIFFEMLRFERKYLFPDSLLDMHYLQERKYEYAGSTER